MTDTATQPEAAPEASTAPVVDTAPATDADLFDDPKNEQFPRAYVEKLRNEAAGHRTRAAQYDEAFGKYSAEDQQVWRELASTVFSDQKAGARWLARIAKGLDADLTLDEAVDAAGAAPAAEAETAAPAEKPLTRAEMEKFIADRDYQREQEALITGITKEAEGLGYKDKTPEFNNLLWIAANETGGDLSKAHEKMEAQKQAIIDDYLEKKRQGAGGVTTPKGGLPTAGAERQIKSLADAHEAAKARIAGVLGART